MSAFPPIATELLRRGELRKGPFASFRTAEKQRAYSLTTDIAVQVEINCRNKKATKTASYVLTNRTVHMAAFKPELAAVTSLSIARPGTLN